MCRILLGTWLLCFMARTATRAQPQPHWAWAGVGLYAALCLLNAYWFQRICVIIWRQVMSRLHMLVTYPGFYGRIETQPDQATEVLQVTGVQPAKPAEKIRAPGSFKSPHIGQLLAMRARFRRQAAKLRRHDSAKGSGVKESGLIPAHQGSGTPLGMRTSGHLQAMYMRHI